MFIAECLLGRRVLALSANLNLRATIWTRIEIFSKYCGVACNIRLKKLSIDPAPVRCNWMKCEYSTRRLVRSGQVWGLVPKERVTAYILRLYPFGFRLAIAQAEARPVMPISFRQAFTSLPEHKVAGLTIVRPVPNDSAQLATPLFE